MTEQEQSPAPTDALSGKNRQYNNGDRPLVMLYLGSEQNVTRGDVQGYKGIARRFCEKARADLVTFDAQTLEQLYPAQKPAERAVSFLREKGMPDILLSHEKLPDEADAFMKESATGCAIRSFNENLRGQILSPYLGRDQGIPYDLVVHDLTPEDLAYEGNRFAEEYAELPRPFIAINLIDLGPEEARGLVRRVAAQTKEYGEATYFICSCHRTPDASHDAAVAELRNLTGNDSGRYPVVGYNLNFAVQREGTGQSWNPYKGMLAEADHVIIGGYSHSVMSESIAAGKPPYLWGMSPAQTFMELGFAKHLALTGVAKTLETRKIENPPDIGTLLAETLIDILHDVRDGKSTFYNAPTGKTGYLEL